MAVRMLQDLNLHKVLLVIVRLSACSYRFPPEF